MSCSIQQLLKDFGCTDLKSTMARFLDDEEFYVMILNQMLEDPGFAQLETQLSGTDVKAVFDTAHMLKGIIANCGIMPMFDEIVKIVEPLRAGNIEGLLPYFKKKVELRDELKKQLEESGNV